MPVQRKIRWDRITVAMLLLIILIFVFGSCMRGCGDDEPVSPVAQNTQVTETSITELTGGSDTSGTDVTGTGVSAASGSASAGTASGTSADTTSTTVTTASATTAKTHSTSANNLPVIITDNPVIEPFPSSTSANNQSSGNPSYTLPAGYTERTVSLSDMQTGNLILVDKDHPAQLTNDVLDLEQVYYAADKPDTYEISYPGHTALNKTALSQFNRLMKAYYEATNNKEIMFNYGYLSAGKEKSNPESATALDIQLHIKRSDGGYEYVSYTNPYAWLYDHMDRYGFINRYPNDKAEITGVKGGYTAIRYVGVPHAAYMTENNLCLEEYLDLLRSSHNFYTGTPLSYSTPELHYSIYYVPANSTGDTALPVPSAGSYEVSGNNVDGFVVTVVVG